MQFEKFEQLDIPQALREALADMDFLTPTPVQAQSIPPALAGRDIVGTAQTGTGKTAAFAIPLLTALYDRPGKLGLILAPTRELAAQIHKVMDRLCRDANMRGALVVGGESFARQARELREGVDYLVATPGRLKDHLEQRTVDLSQVAVLVLDEVDRMLDMGFLPQIRAVLKPVPRDRQTMLFSATLPAEVQRFVDTLVRNPLRVKIGETNRTNSLVAHTVRRMKHTDKHEALLDEVRRREGKILVFVRTQSRTYRVTRMLTQKGYASVLLHGGRSQGQRKQALALFRGDKHPILVATDLAGRGLDVVDVDHVINFDLPANREDLIHRIGRTGRNERRGEAVSFVESGNRDEEKLVAR